MPAVTLATTELNRRYGHLLHFRLTNGFIEEDKTNEVNGTAWLQRPGLSSPQTIGTAGTIRMIWNQEGTFSGDWVILCGTILSRLTLGGTLTNVGTIPGSDFPVIAGGTDSVIIVSEGIAYTCNGTSTSTVIIPDSEFISSVAYINGYFLLPVVDSQKCFWINPGDTNPTALNYFSAERAADNIVTVVTQGDTIWFLKQTNEEVWIPTGSADAPFQRVTGRVSTYGCVSRNCVAICGPAIAWVASDRQIVVADGTPQVLSSPSDTEALRGATTVMRSWFYSLDGHSFYILTTSVGTFAVDLSTGSIARYTSLNRNSWRAHLGSQKDTVILAGDSETNTVWTLDADASSDNGDVFARQVGGFISNVGEPISCDSLSLNVDVGWSPTPGVEPLLQMRFSDDQGNTWSSWKEKSLGDQGYYGKDITFRSLGLIVRPGRLFQFRMTDNARFRLSYVRINEV